jgi:hypothetical protein
VVSSGGWGNGAAKRGTELSWWGAILSMWDLISKARLAWLGLPFFPSCLVDGQVASFVVVLTL